MNSIRAATAVLYDQRSKSRLTLSISRWVALWTSSSAGAGGRSTTVARSTSPVPRRHTRARKRRQPSIISSVCSVQSKSSAGGPTNRWNRRSASAPTRVEVLGRSDQVALGLGHLGPAHADHALGEQALERLPQPARSKPDVAEGPGVEAGVEQVQDGVLDAADVLVDGHPVARPRRGRRVPPAVQGSQKRRKYHDESTKVSMVSVSRSAGPPHVGQVVCRKPSWYLQRRLAGRAELDVVGRQHRQLGLRHGNHAVLGAVDDRDGAPPEPLAADQPVPQAVVDLARSRCLRASSHSMALALAVATSGAASSQSLLMLGPSPVYASPSQAIGRLHGADDGQAVGLGEIPVPLVLARARP